MRNLLFFSAFYLVFTCFAQEKILDSRDNKSYRIVDIDGTLWMVDNLDFETELSSPVSENQRAKNPILSGRFYDLRELDCACPKGWVLPDPDDWLSYFEYIIRISGSDITLGVSASFEHLAIEGYDKQIDLFAKDNPLNLTPTGRVEGVNYSMPDLHADFWTMDAPSFDLSGKQHKTRDHVHIIHSIEGKTHIHIRKNGFTNIHSHKHHLNPKNKKKMRKFMIRCVKKKTY